MTRWCGHGATEVGEVTGFKLIDLVHVTFNMEENGFVASRKSSD